jgi:hypothetical protein
MNSISILFCRLIIPTGDFKGLILNQSLEYDKNLMQIETHVKEFIALFLKGRLMMHLYLILQVDKPALKAQNRIIDDANNQYDLDASNLSLQITNGASA